MERDRDATEQRLIDALGLIIEEKGFEKLGVNGVCEKAGVSKVLLYRYFGSLDALIYEYIKKNDFWINTPLEIPDSVDMKDYLKMLFRMQITQYRTNTTLKRLYRWELSTSNKMVLELRANREKNGLQIIHNVCRMSNLSPREIAPLATIVTAAINYLSLLEEHCDAFNQIKIQTDEGWEEIALGIDRIIDILFK